MLILTSKNSTLNKYEGDKYTFYDAQTNALPTGETIPVKVVAETTFYGIAKYRNTISYFDTDNKVNFIRYYTIVETDKKTYNKLKWTMFWIKIKKILHV